jgi:hypothetical protein
MLRESRPRWRLIAAATATARQEIQPHCKDEVTCGRSKQCQHSCSEFERDYAPEQAASEMHAEGAFHRRVSLLVGIVGMLANVVRAVEWLFSHEF